MPSWRHSTGFQITAGLWLNWLDCGILLEIKNLVGKVLTLLMIPPYLLQRHNIDHRHSQRSFRNTKVFSWSMRRFVLRRLLRRKNYPVLPTGIPRHQGQVRSACIGIRFGMIMIYEGFFPSDEPKYWWGQYER